MQHQNSHDFVAIKKIRAGISFRNSLYYCMIYPRVMGVEKEENSNGEHGLHRNSVGYQWSLKSNDKIVKQAFSLKGFLRRK